MTARVLVAGVDEAGRGPLAGPVVASAVILNDQDPIEGLADSKVLSAGSRDLLEAEIKQRALCWSLGRAEVQEIDELNILQATLLAMRRAVLGLQREPTEVLIDGNSLPDLPFPARAIVKGDATVAVISAASILAKVARDREMKQMDEYFQGYGFAHNMGYPTRTHVQALQRLGVTPIHRRSFAPVRRVLEALQSQVQDQTQDKLP